MHLFPLAASGWTPRALTCSAWTGKGIRELWAAIEEHRALTSGNGWRQTARNQQQRQWMRELIDHELRRHFDTNAQVRERMAALEREVVEGQTTSFRAAQTLLDAYLKSK